jgi:hypothetical protein
MKISFFFFQVRVLCTLPFTVPQCHTILFVCVFFPSISCQTKPKILPKNNKKILPVAKRFNFSTMNAQLQCGNQKENLFLFRVITVDNKFRILPLTFACYLGVKYIFFFPSLDDRKTRSSYLMRSVHATTRR